MDSATENGRAMIPKYFICMIFIYAGVWAVDSYRGNVVIAEESLTPCWDLNDIRHKHRERIREYDNRDEEDDPELYTVKDSVCTETGEFLVTKLLREYAR